MSIDCEILSPCTKNCKLNDDKDLCTGCLRKIDEIICWKTYTKTEKLEILNYIKER